MQQNYTELQLTPWDKLGELAIKKLNSLHRNLPVVIGSYSDVKTSLELLGTNAQHFFEWVLLEVIAHVGENGDVIIREDMKGRDHPPIYNAITPVCDSISSGYVRISNKEELFSIRCGNDLNDTHEVTASYAQYQPSVKMYMLIGILLSAVAHANKLAATKTHVAAPEIHPNQFTNCVDRIIKRLREYIEFVVFTDKAIEMVTRSMHVDSVIEFTDWLCDDTRITYTEFGDDVQYTSTLRVYFDKHNTFVSVSCPWMDIVFTGGYSNPTCIVNGPIKVEWNTLKAIVASIFGEPKKHAIATDSTESPVFPPNQILDQNDIKFPE